MDESRVHERKQYRPIVDNLDHGSNRTVSRFVQSAKQFSAIRQTRAGIMIDWILHPKKAPLCSCNGTVPAAKVTV
jgi:hypothetical protein